MSLHKSFNNYEIKLLTEHGLPTHFPSQLSDAFVLGLRVHSEEVEALLEVVEGEYNSSEDLRCEKEDLIEQNAELIKQRQRISRWANFHISKLLKHNEVSPHDREMMRQLLSYIKGGGRM